MEKENKMIRIIKKIERLNCLNWYIGINSNHPLYEVEYLDLRNDEALYCDVHWWLTYSSHFNPEKLEKDDLWYFWFDTAHFWDDNSYVQNEDYINKQLDNLEKFLHSYQKEKWL